MYSLRYAYTPAFLIGFLLQVVLCTNVAETSLTVDDCCLVIDSGRQKSAECARATGDVGEIGEI